MRRIMTAIAMSFLLSASYAAEPAGRILVVQDEMPQMEVLGKYLESKGYVIDFVSTKEEMPDTATFDAIVVFVHGQFPQDQAEAVIDFTKKGGRTLCLHHTISSAKRKTPVWLEFLGMRLPEPLRKPLEGGYGWQHGVDLHLVNLAPDHYITSNKVEYPHKVEYKRSDVDEAARTRPCLVFPDSEVFLNHQFSDENKTILFGFTASHPDIGEKTWIQDRGGWLKPTGKGWALYFMPGHIAEDLENPNYQQIILNCLTWKPKSK